MYGKQTAPSDLMSVPHGTANAMAVRCKRQHTSRATSCAPLVQALLNSHYSYQQGLLSCKLRAAITCIVFKKTLLVSAVDMSAFSTGQPGVALWL